MKKSKIIFTSQKAASHRMHNEKMIDQRQKINGKIPSLHTIFFLIKHTDYYQIFDKNVNYAYIRTNLFSSYSFIRNKFLMKDKLKFLNIKMYISFKTIYVTHTVFNHIHVLISLLLSNDREHYLYLIINIIND